MAPKPFVAPSVRFPSLDGLRALAIAGVVWRHAHPLAGGVSARTGTLGVDLFFAISGFLITTLLLRERAESGGVAVGSFYARRALRIFPLYYAVLTAYVLHALFLREHGAARDHFFRSLPAHATYTTNLFMDVEGATGIVFGFAWSLTVEEQFYVVWPWLFRRGRSLAVPVLVAIVLLVLRLAGERGLLPFGGFALRVVLTFAVPICLGSLVAIGLQAPSTRGSLVAILGGRSSSLVALVLVIASIALDWPMPIVHASMAALVAACAARPDHWIAPLTDAAWLRHVGVVSYGIYLFHGAIVGGARRVVGPGLLAFGIGVAVTPALATVRYRYFESFFLRKRDRFRNRPSAPA